MEIGNQVNTTSGTGEILSISNDGETFEVQINDGGTYDGQTYYLTSADIW